MPRKPYPTDVSDEEWSFSAPYLTLMDLHAPQREHDLREVFNALRWLDAGCFEAMASDLRSIIRVAQGRQGQPSAVVMDGRTLQSSCESGPRAGYDGYKCKRGSKVHMAVDTLGHLLAVHVTPAYEQERAQVRTLCEQVQQATKPQATRWSWPGQTKATRASRRARQPRTTELIYR
jgi:transposase